MDLGRGGRWRDLRGVIIGGKGQAQNQPAGLDGGYWVLDKRGMCECRALRRGDIGWSLG